MVFWGVSPAYVSLTIVGVDAARQLSTTNGTKRYEWAGHTEINDELHCRDLFYTTTKPQYNQILNLIVSDCEQDTGPNQTLTLPLSRSNPEAKSSHSSYTEKYCTFIQSNRSHISMVADLTF